MSSSYLVLEDGSVLEGEPFGHRGPAEGEVVFSTCMSGYQESLADPASGGQVIVMTYPLVGNYGVSGEFFSTRSLRARGLVVREYCKEPSPMYGGRTLDELLRRDGVPGISGIDTRDLAIRIRSAGTLRGALTEDEGGIDGLAKRLRLSPFPHERDLAGEASCKRISTHGSGKGVRMGVLDLGDGEGAMRALSRDFDVTVFPHDTPADVISAHKVKGLVVSDGPGDPSHP
ncbi:MAG: carbamoyl-phosphate synthase small subunit, partial [Methanomassiliicoccaceae archaeon]|nr:carbamoyl-phosphate synthase small subunit [Methanomassiliicoccaceae archaeon]